MKTGRPLGDSDKPRAGFIFFRHGIGCRYSRNCFKCTQTDCNWRAATKNNHGVKYIPTEIWSRDFSGNGV